jgi:beta-phosphoglucomutase-like phosphatase (HAD superfamily)
VFASAVECAKPDRAAYAFALENLHEAPGDCIAVEDNIGGVQAAVAAGVACVAFPKRTPRRTTSPPRGTASTDWMLPNC